MFSISPRASRASLLTRRRETTCCRLPLCPCTLPLLISLQPLLKLPLLSLGLSQLQFVSTVWLLLNHGKPDLDSMCVFLSFYLVLRISPWIRKKIGCARYFGRVATVLVLTTWYIAFCDPTFRIRQIFNRCECQSWRCYHLLPPAAAPFGFLRDVLHMKDLSCPSQKYRKVTMLLVRPHIQFSSVQLLWLCLFLFWHLTVYNFQLFDRQNDHKGWNGAEITRRGARVGTAEVGGGLGYCLRLGANGCGDVQRPHPASPPLPPRCCKKLFDVLFN